VTKAQRKTKNEGQILTFGKIDLSVEIGKIKLKNPVMVASGTFGCGEEYAQFFDINRLGALVTKTITLEAREGNLPPRTVETPSGLLNAIGLENPGVDKFIEEKISFLRKLRIPVIVSIAGAEIEEYAALARRLSKIEEISGLELNISCPNVKGKIFAQDEKATFKVVEAVKKVTDTTIITKLSPNVTDITGIARAAEDAGSDAISLVNTFLGMAIDIETEKPKLGGVTGGLSGPAIKPIALRMVWEVAEKVSVPVIGMGGITDTADALEFLIAGAKAVAVGTANFVNPVAAVEIVEGIKKWRGRKKCY